MSEEPWSIEVAPRLLVRMAALSWRAADGLRSPDLATAVDDVLAATDGEIAEHVASLAIAAIARERSHLYEVVGSPSFLRAIAVSQPGLVDQTASHLRRFAGSDAHAPPTKARHLRFESTLVNLVQRGVGRPTPNAAWCGVFVVDTSTEPTEDERLWTTRDAPEQERLHIQIDLPVLVEAIVAAGGDAPTVAHEDCWSWLDDAIATLAEPARTRWTDAVAGLHGRCLEIGPALAATTADDWVTLHRDASATVDELRVSAGLAPIGLASVLRVDWRLPVTGTAPPVARADGERAIADWLQVQSGLGFGPLWARATADALTTQGTRPSPDGGPTRLPTFASLLARIGDDTHVAEATALTQRLDDTITAAGGWAAPAVPASPESVSPDRMGPWGSALLVPERSGFSVRSVRGEPALFQSRLLALVPEVIDDIRHGLALAPTPARSCRLRHHLNPGSALGATMAEPLPGTSEPDLELLAVDRAHVGVVVDGNVVVPVLDTAAMPSFGDLSPAEMALVRATLTWGWELVASGLPLHPRELEGRGHLPALTGPNEIVVHPERWLLSPTELAACASAATRLERFVAFRRLLRRRSMPDVLVVRLAPSPSTPHHLVLGDSMLSVEAFLRSAPAVDGIAVAMRGPGHDSLVPDPDGQLHVAEVAVSFVDHAFPWPP